MFMVVEAINEVLLANSFFEGVITNNLSLADDMGFDSLRMVELIVALEERFNITFKESDLDPDVINTVGDLYTLVDKYTL